MRSLFRVVSLAVTLLVFVAQPGYAQHADTVLVNGKVYSLNWSDPGSDGVPASDAPYSEGRWHADASAVAISGNKIVRVGADEDVSKLIGDDTKVINLGGATVIPGLIDSHVHIAEYGEVLENIDLSDAVTPALVIKKLKENSTHLKAAEWLIGQGWDEGAWANNYPNRQMLDEVFPDNPVYLRSLHGFGLWVNTKALELAGIDNQTTAPVGGEIRRDENGVATGILLNNATGMIAHAVPKPNTEKFASYIHRGLMQMAKDGYVSVHEAGAKTLHIDAFEYLHRKGQLPIRVYAMLSARDKVLSKQWQKKGPKVDSTGFLDIRSVKAYYDGALGSRGARLIADYSDRPGHRGISGDGYGYDADVVNGLISAGFQVGIHAIGDAGNREVLDFFSAANDQYPDSINLRHRIEHAQVIHPDDFKRFKQLSIIASLEPPHAVEDKAWAEDRLGPERIKGAYAWRTFRETGVPITFNSDLPGSDHSIFYALHAATTRRDKQKQPTEGWYPEQNVSIEEAIRAYTSWAAYSAFRENDTGVLKPGFWADLTVMDIDPFELADKAPSEILDGKVLMTIVNGDVVYGDESLLP